MPRIPDPMPVARLASFIASNGNFRRAIVSFHHRFYDKIVSTSAATTVTFTRLTRKAVVKFGNALPAVRCLAHQRSPMESSTSAVTMGNSTPRREEWSVKWKFRTDGERRFEAKGLNGFLPKTQTIADPFDIFLSSPVVAQARFTLEVATEMYMRSTSSRGSNAGNSRPAMSFTLHRPLPMAFVFFGSWDSYFYAVDAATGKENGAFTVAKTAHT